MAKLPLAEMAVVQDSKVSYLLDATHPQNGGKAALFLGFGFKLEEPAVFRDALLKHPLENTVKGGDTSSHGVFYEVRCNVRSPDGRDPCITSVWMISPSDPPRLITAYGVK